MRQQRQRWGPYFTSYLWRQLNPNEIDTIIFEDDLNNFGTWWEKNVKDFVLDEHMSAGFRSKHEKIRNMLLAIWCTEKDYCDQSKCSLGRCILDIDEKLRSGKFVYRSDNPNVVSAPDNIIKECLEVDNLTRQQHDVLIDGPAGAGKSVVLIAKAIQLAKSNNKVILFYFMQRLRLPTIYEKAFEKAQIRCHTINFLKISGLFDIICTCSVDSEVKVILVQVMMQATFFDILLQSITNIISNLKEEYNVFIDDFQCIYNGMISPPSDEPNEIRSTLGTHLAIMYDVIILSACCEYLWLAVDFLQSFPYMDGKKYDMRGIRWCVESALLGKGGWLMYHLPSNLRNTCDLSNVLSILRNNRSSEGLPYPPGINDIPAQVKGHYIHGPRTSFFVFRNFNIDSISSCLYKELRTVSHDGILNLSHPYVCAIVNYVQIWSSYKLDLLGITGMLKNADMYHLWFLRAFSRRLKMLNIDYTRFVCPQGYAYSAEWPAVIVLHEMSEQINSMDIASLNLSMSRARVYCSVILFPKYGEQLNDYYLDAFLDKLKGHASITECS